MLRPMKDNVGEISIPVELRDKMLAGFERIALNVTPGDGMLLRVLVQSRGAKRGVEIGTATGFGALNMGLAFERTGGHLVTIDPNPEMVRTTRANLTKYGLDRVVTVIEGDALVEIPKLTGNFDFVFIDALKRDYLKYFQLIDPRLKPNAVLVADNVVQHGEEMKDFLDFMLANPHWEVVIIRASIEKNDGMAVCYKLR
jgi:predicted O-methyltransferase YrrM